MSAFKGRVKALVSSVEVELRKLFAAVAKLWHSLVQKLRATVGAA